ncbi:type II toxin-antitoxin system RelE/ParE family toxin [Cupriavidus sp. SK-4]|uniref:type II toxin-antitoxin system RelE/ParE family toxin n=1 Tax=Cupriavidus sp. SK-4 TaxID=574750 RepID=UPI000A04708E|nr:type II toxin-antitoxin system RelE/ParE family toxin [Cupriavidus sp. SK-4]
MRAVEWTAWARADLLAIVDYISDDNPDAAQHLKDELQAKAACLPEHPWLYRAGRVAGTREMVVGANYVVVYPACLPSVCPSRLHDKRDASGAFRHYRPEQYDRVSPDQGSG